VDKLNEGIKLVFKQYGIEFTEILYCPHHPSLSQCLCRKPGSLLIEKALAKFKIDPLKSYMIGDSGHDTEAAEAVGVKGIRINPNSNLFEELNHIFQNLDSL
jgi:D-glycero-D-manno-heptose 1,7-bisphosphate phosphatase